MNSLLPPSSCHPEWENILSDCFEQIDKEYIKQLAADSNWLPGRDKLLAAFSLAFSQTKYVLLGESPYPRAESANGFAFWDNAVGSLWSHEGFSKPVNKATSLRNWMKMLLVARGDLGVDTSQLQISRIDKSKLVQTAEQFFTGMMDKGILLLNASLVYSPGKVPFHARHWKPFIQQLFKAIVHKNPNVQFILFGKFAAGISLDTSAIALACEHPYNVSFIKNPRVLEFFKPLDLLSHDTY